MTLNPLLFALCLVTLLSCHTNGSSQKAENVNIKTDSLYPTGIVHNNILLPGYSEESVALYVPSTFSSSKSMPLMIFLDPHSAGELPLQKYKSLAEQYNVILVGSNNCKNAILFEKNIQFVEHLMLQLNKCIRFDSTKIALCGFSGGAKLAIIEGFRNPLVTTVIYSGAVVPIASTPINKKLIGFAGERDMNYTDLIQFDRSLPNSIPHQLVNWKGKHEWPDESVFKEAFIYFLKGKTTENIAFKPTITDDKVQQEQLEKQNYLQAFQQKDLNWWKNAIDNLNKQKASNPMYERLLGFISLACYSFAGSSLQQENLPAAEKIISIYQMADPTNNDAKKYREELNRRKNQLR